MKQEDINMAVCYSYDCEKPPFARSIWPHETAEELGLLLPWCKECWEGLRVQEPVFEFNDDDFWKECWSD